MRIFDQAARSIGLSASFSVRVQHIIARQLTQSAPSRTAIWLNPPALVRLPAEPGLRLAPGVKFRRLHSQSDRFRRYLAIWRSLGGGLKSTRLTPRLTPWPLGSTSADRDPKRLSSRPRLNGC